MKKTALIFTAALMCLVPAVSGPAHAQSQIENVSDEELIKLEENAEAGDVEAMHALGVYYEEEEEELQKAAKWFRMGAEAGHLKSMHRLGLMYRWGKGVPTNGRKAEKWFLKAANENYGPAQSALGEIYADGYVLPKNKSESVRWYSAAAQHGDRIGEFFIGMKYMHGDSQTQQDFNAAAEWLKKSADQGYAPAQAQLGMLYQYGYGVAQDGQKAYELFMKSADQGDLDGLYYAGTSLLGQRDPQYHPQGFEYIRQAAEEGYVPAMKMMPNLYQTGKGTQPSGKEAYKWHVIMYELTPTSAKKELAHIKNQMHHLGDYVSNKDRAEAHAAAEKWVREYKNRQGVH